MLILNTKEITTKEKSLIDNGYSGCQLCTPN